MLTFVPAIFLYFFFKNTSYTCSSTRTSPFDKLCFLLKLLCLNLCIIILRFRLPIPPFTTTDTTRIRSSFPVVLYKIGFLTITQNLLETYLHLCLSLVFNETADLQCLTLSKKRVRQRFLSCEIREISHITLFIEPLWTAGSAQLLFLLTVPRRLFAFSNTISHIFFGWVFCQLNLKTRDKSELNTSTAYISSQK